ncbi:hypothetical protein BN1007_30203 [Klebsiella variicola]|nr:hypothetical protein BN1007_30203 [Klebsiella variicola]
MIHHRTLANFTLVSNVLVTRPALPEITGVIRQLKKNQFAQRVSDLNFHSLNHQIHAHTKTLVKYC